MYIKSRLTFRELLSRTWRTQVSLLTLVTIITVLYMEWLHQYVKVSTTVVTVLGTALAFFVAFTNSHAYDRWWEARTIWGALVNDSRSWGRMVVSFLSPGSTAKEEHDRIQQFQKRMIFRHLAFTCATKEKPRNESHKEYLKYLTDEEIQQLEAQSDVPGAILTLQGKALQIAERNHDIDVIRMA